MSSVSPDVRDEYSLSRLLPSAHTCNSLTIMSPESIRFVHAQEPTYSECGKSPKFFSDESKRRGVLSHRKRLVKLDECLVILDITTHDTH